MHSIEILRKDVKNFTLRVKPNGKTELVVPLLATKKHIDKILEKRKNWIDEKKEYFSKFKSVEKKLISGENMKYLGKNYRLKVYETYKNERVILSRGKLNLYVKNKDDYNKKLNLIECWYKEKAMIHFLNTVNKYNKITQKDSINVRIRKMKTRWGSCNKTKKYINLNLNLIKKPKICIEYVVFHELAHLIYPNHSKDFYNYLSLYMSDWKEREKILNEAEI
ncbi:M48 family metallopeptidase [Campylobacter ureolyticus]|uniref:M48 family metallopeptidase n=1 Tax=Campylobacter ureolyticus TaxID=827 RepID=UPI0022B5C97B|nr:SprT family zinc-dependent metalloprotease [Campylobacter ureolyticus]MCZ6167427.1 SprT family zinc-dependent metalloprotease [Campylobacter ureolyticus]